MEFDFESLQKAHEHFVLCLSELSKFTHSLPSTYDYKENVSNRFYSKEQWESEINQLKKARFFQSPSAEVKELLSIIVKEGLK